MLMTEVQVRSGGREVLNRQLIVTNHDVECLLDALRELVAGVHPRFELETLEGHALVEGRTGAEVTANPTHAALSLWVGEPYRLMSGVRIIASFESISHFCVELAGELRGALSRVAQ
jgi:hypothetical protein